MKLFGFKYVSKWFFSAYSRRYRGEIGSLMSGPGLGRSTGYVYCCIDRRWMDGRSVPSRLMDWQLIHMQSSVCCLYSFARSEKCPAEISSRLTGKILAWKHW